MENETEGWTLDGQTFNGRPIQVHVLRKRDMLANLEHLVKFDPVFALRDAWITRQAKGYPEDIRMVWSYVIPSDGTLRHLSMISWTKGRMKAEIQWPAADISWRDPKFKRGFANLIRRMVKALVDDLGKAVSRKELQDAERWGEQLVKDLPTAFAPSHEIKPPVRIGRFGLNADGSTGMGPGRWS